MLTRQQLTKLRRTKANGANKLKAAIDIAKVTQVQVADGIGSTQSHISEIANGNYSKLPFETARSLARFFGCAIEDLFPAREQVAS